MTYMAKINEIEMRVGELECYLKNNPENPQNYKRLELLEFYQRELITFEELQILKIIT